jgi:hypothetical protein
MLQNLEGKEVIEALRRKLVEAILDANSVPLWQHVPPKQLTAAGPPFVTRSVEASVEKHLRHFSGACTRFQKAGRFPR